LIDHPDIPLHTNGSERDIRSQVTKRKISGGMRSDVGRACRDTFLGLAKTSAKLGITFRDYLGSRLGIAGQPDIPPLSDLIRCRSQPDSCRYPWKCPSNIALSKMGCKVSQVFAALECGESVTT